MSSDAASKQKALESRMDPYRILGIDRGADDAAIKRAYFQLVRKFPPEREPDKFREVRMAYEALRDPESRARTDLFLIQPPPALPSRRRPSYDLSVHTTDLVALAAALLATPMTQEFREV